MTRPTSSVAGRSELACFSESNFRRNASSSWVSSSQSDPRAIRRKRANSSSGYWLLATSNIRTIGDSLDF